MERSTSQQNNPKEKPIQRAENQNFWNLFLIFSMFFVSNLSAFVFVIWLNPQFVFFETIIWALFACLCIWILYRQGRSMRIFQYFQRHWIILPFVIYTGISAFWSMNVGITIFRWVILVSTLITGTYMGVRYDIKELVKLLTIFGIFILFFSTLLAFLVPAIGIMNYYSIQGAWKGLYWHKNHLGIITTFFNIIFLFNLFNSIYSHRKNMVFHGSTYLFSLYVLYQTDSVGSYISTILLHGEVLFLYLLLKYHKKMNRIFYYSMIALLIVAAILVFLNLQMILSLFGRNSSLTGRIPMWGYLFHNYFNARPLLGYGFNAFWYSDAHRIFLQHASGYPDPIVIADNGFIDLIINNGIVGFVLFLLVYLGAFWQSAMLALRAKTFIGVFPLVLMSFTLIANISWSLIYENENFIFLVVFAVLFCVTSYEKPLDLIEFPGLNEITSRT